MRKKITADIERTPITLVLLAAGLAGCTNPQGGPYSSQPLPMTTRAAMSGNLSSLSRGLSYDIGSLQRQQNRDNRIAAQQARMPHPVSAAYSGQLTPVTGLASFVSGKTLYLQTPIVQNGAHVRTDVAPIYFAADGRSYSRTWSGAPWQVSGSDLCTQNGRQPNCMTALSDSTGQAFLLGPNRLLMQVGRISNGDSDGVRAAYAEAQRNRERQDEIAGRLLLAVIGGMVGGGGGGGGSGSSHDSNDMLVRQQERDREARENARVPEPSYSAPAISSFYDTSRGVSGVE